MRAMFIIVIGFALLGIVGAIVKWANSNPAVNKIFEYSDWKRNLPPWLYHP